MLIILFLKNIFKYIYRIVNTRNLKDREMVARYFKRFYRFNTVNLPTVSKYR